MKKIKYDNVLYYYKIITIENIDFILVSTLDNPLENAIVHLYSCYYTCVYDAVKRFHQNKENYR